MKKLIIVVILLQTFMLTVFSLQVYKNKTENELLYNNKAVVNFVLDSKITGFINYLNNLSSEVTITKYVYIDDNNIIVYTNDLTMNGMIKTGDVKINNPGEQFIANYDSGKKEQLAKFRTYIPDVNITVRPFEAMITAGGDSGQYYFSSMTDVTEIIVTLNDSYGFAELYSEASPTNFANYLYETEHLYVGVILLFSLLVFILVHYSIDRGKKIAVLKVQGLPLRNIFTKIAQEFTKVIIWGGLAGVIVVLMATIIFSLHAYLSTIVPAYLLMFFVGVLFSSLVVLFSLIMLKKFGQVTLLIKGAKPYKTIIFLHLFLKTVFLIFFLGGTMQVFNLIAELKTHEKHYVNWQQTENYYGTVTKVSAKNRQTHANLFTFYQKMEEHGALMIKADNYSANFSKEGNEVLLYELNTVGEESYYSSDGKSIVVNTNYLHKYPVSIEGNFDKVYKQIIFAEDVRNILVPKSLAKYEDKLKENHLANFYFQKVEVENIYNKADNLPLNEMSIEDLKVNIIYIDDGYEAFAYNPNVEMANGFTVNDPVIVVETGNIDLDYYVSYLSSCVYFSYEGIEPYAEILPLVTEAEVTSEIQSVEPLYTYFGDIIRNIGKEKSYLQVALTMSAIVFLVVSYLATASYFTDRKQKLYVQKVHGYGLGERIKFFLTILLILSLITIVGSYLVNGDGRILLLGVAVVIVDLLFVLAESSYLDKKAGNIYD